MPTRSIAFPTALTLATLTSIAGCGSQGAAGAPGDAAAPNDAAPAARDGSDGDGEAGSRLVDSGHAGDDSGPVRDGASGDANDGSDGQASGPLKTMFLIMMANRDWASIKGSASAPYVNSLLTTAAHAEQYYAPSKNSMSEPNDIWLEAGGDLGIVDDFDPLTNHRATTQHLVALLANANIPWKAYAEDISGQSCPLLAVNHFVPQHTPMVFFDDVTEGNQSTSATCIAHVRPYSELADDLSTGHVARYNVVSPNLCNDMAGGVGCGPSNVDEIKAGDTWLSTEVPKITASPAYKDGGAIFIVWDDGTLTAGRKLTDAPIGCVVLSPKSRQGYASSTAFTHSATLKTIEEILGVTPLLGAAATSNDLAEMFTSFP